MPFIKRILKVCLLILLVGSFYHIRNQYGIHSMEDAHIWLQSISNPKYVVLLYMALTVSASVLCLPISWFKACGAVYFGFTFGFLYGYLIALFSAILSFAIGRFLGKEAVEKIYDRHFKANAKMAWFDKKNSTFFIHIFVLRNLYFVPFSLTNYLLSVSKVSFKTYFAATALGMLPGTGIFTYFIAHSFDYVKNPETLILPALIALGYYGLLIVFIKKRSSLVRTA